MCVCLLLEQWYKKYILFMHPLISTEGLSCFEALEDMADTKRREHCSIVNTVFKWHIRLERYRYV